MRRWNVADSHCSLSDVLYVNKKVAHADVSPSCTGYLWNKYSLRSSGLHILSWYAVFKSFVIDAYCELILCFTFDFTIMSQVKCSLLHCI